ncbi:MAG: hypothetical protein Q9222_001288 [Ikaeria aurantiellina]
MLLRSSVFIRSSKFHLPWHRTFSSSCKSSASDLQELQQLPRSPARTRFAPSPTGYLHLGSLRTALFNYLLAKATGGQFLLRVEDTDKKRTITDAEERLYGVLRWAGLQWDEEGPDIGGPHGPYKQSERTVIYQEHAEKLLHSGHAYRCFCSAEKLNELARRRASLGLPSDYDRTCEGLPSEQSDERASKGETFVVRLKIPIEPPEYVDLVYGLVGKPTHKTKARNLGEALYEDPILLKTDGLPTYHLANVVDDHHMDITHVIRATEWMSSTPKHLILYKAFGWKAPRFAHVGLLQDSSRQKFSKRKGDLDIQKFKDEGIFPEALLNYVALYGWAHTSKSDFLSLSDLIRSFNMRFTKGNTIVEPHKLLYLQKKYAASFADEGGELFEALVDKLDNCIGREIEKPSWYPEHCYSSLVSGDDLRTRIAGVLRQTAKNYTNPKAFFDDYKYFFCEEPLPDPNSNRVAADVLMTRISLEPYAKTIYNAFQKVMLEDWTDLVIKETLTNVIDILASGSDISDELSNDTHSRMTYRSVQLYLRWAIARGGSGPPMHATMVLLGREVCLRRLDEVKSMFAAQRSVHSRVSAH